MTPFERAPPRPWSVRDVLLLTALIAVHLAVGRTRLELLIALGPLTLSAPLIEWLRQRTRWSRPAAVASGLLGAAGLLALLVGVTAAAAADGRYRADLPDRWSRVIEQGAEATGRAACWFGVCSAMIGLWYLAQRFDDDSP